MPGWALSSTIPAMRVLAIRGAGGRLSDASRRRCGPGRAGAALVLMAALIAPAAARAAATPAPRIGVPVSVSAAGWAEGVLPLEPGSEVADLVPDLGVSADGHAVIVWGRETVRGWAVEATSLAPGGRWSAPVNLSPGQPAALNTDAASPHVALGVGGAAVVTWVLDRLQGFDGGDVVRVATHPAGGAWSRPLGLEPATEEAWDPHIGLDSAGDAVVAWEGRHELTTTTGGIPDVESIVQVSDRPAAGEWSLPATLVSTTHGLTVARPVVSPGGEATVVWERGTPRGLAVIEAAARDRGGSWSAPVLLDSRATDLSIAAAPDGRATAVWWRHLHIGRRSEVEARAATYAPGSGWSAATTLSRRPLVPNPWGPTGAMSATGDATVVWEGRPPNCRPTHAACFALQATTRPSAGAWTAPARVAPRRRDDVGEPMVAMSARGDTVVAYAHPLGRRVPGARHRAPPGPRNRRRVVAAGPGRQALRHRPLAPRPQRYGQVRADLGRRVPDVREGPRRDGTMRHNRRLTGEFAAIVLSEPRRVGAIDGRAVAVLALRAETAPTAPTALSGLEPRSRRTLAGLRPRRLRPAARRCPMASAPRSAETATREAQIEAHAIELQVPTVRG
jgi:hypothetical protein